jgi:hypothetical protein
MNTQELEKERDLYLKENPHLKSFQNELDRVLEKSDDRFNTSVALLAERLVSLSVELQVLSSMTDRHRNLLKALNDL